MSWAILLDMNGKGRTMIDSKLVDPSCREARTTIAMMAAVLLSSGRYMYSRHFDDEKKAAIAEAQALYDGAVKQVVQRHKRAKGKGKGSYPV
jgi:hypothetical protein